MKYLVVGLGNIGEEYANTRHNIGFMVVDSLAKDKEVVFKTDKLGDITEFKYKGRTIYLLKPSTYMNLSGKAVNYWLQQLKINKDNLLVITDEIALPAGKTRLKGKGSNGGHNGLGNIEEVLHTNVYPRLRFGVGNDFFKGKQVDYVLGAFKEEEKDTIEKGIKKAKDTVLSFCTIGIERTMNFFN